MSDKNEKVENLITALTRREPGKRQIKPVEAEMLQLFEDMDDDSDSEYVADEDSGADEDDDDDVDGEYVAKGMDQSEDESDEASESEDEGPVKLPDEVLVDHSAVPVVPPDDLKEKPSDDVKMEVEDIKADAETAVEGGRERRTASKQALQAMKETLCTPQSPPNGTLSGPKPQPNILICMFCLGETQGEHNELIECDGCGIVVHELCYGMSDIISISSTGSSASTEPWFCEACLANQTNPSCELCPVEGGVFKRTDTNRWVHLLCALYTPGVAFNNVEQLTEVTLTELSQKEWSQKECSLCEDRYFAWTGVCISCDAGLCRSFFHVTCAQKYGLLSEPSHDENSADPFFAQCRQHTDKTVTKQRRRNLLSALNRQRVSREERKKRRETREGERVVRKLAYSNAKYSKWWAKRPQPFTPEQKVIHFLETSPVALRTFLRKSQALSLPLPHTTVSLTTEAQKSGPTGVPVFSPDFISYFMDREKKIDSLSSRLSELEHLHRDLQITDGNASHSYNRSWNRLKEVKSKVTNLQKTGQNIWMQILSIAPSIKIPEFLSDLLKVDIESDPMTNPCMTGPTSTANHNGTSAAAAIVRAKRFGIAPSRHVRASKDLANGPTPSTATISGTERAAEGENETAVIHECKICRGVHDQHLLVQCDTCSKSFHLACLLPPLTRMPKKTKLYGWQCSWCTKAMTTDSDGVDVDVDAPRQLRRSRVEGETTPAVSVTGGDDTAARDATVASPVKPPKRKASPVKPKAASGSPKRAKTVSLGPAAHRIKKKTSPAAPVPRVRRRRHIKLPDDSDTVTIGPGVVQLNPFRASQIIRPISSLPRIPSLSNRSRPQTPTRPPTTSAPSYSSPRPYIPPPFTRPLMNSLTNPTSSYPSHYRLPFSGPNKGHSFSVGAFLKPLLSITPLERQNPPLFVNDGDPRLPTIESLTPTNSAQQAGSSSKQLPFIVTSSTTPTISSPTRTRPPHIDISTLPRRSPTNRRQAAIVALNVVHNGCQPPPVPLSSRDPRLAKYQFQGSGYSSSAASTSSQD